MHELNAVTDPLCPALRFCGQVSRIGIVAGPCRAKGSLTFCLAFKTWCELRSPSGLCKAGGRLHAAGKSSALWDVHSLRSLWLCVPHIPSFRRAGQVDGFIAAHAGKRSLQELDDPRLDQQVSW